MATFDAGRALLLLRDIEQSTRGRMAGLKVEAVEGAVPRVRCVADRLALLRLGVQLAASALSPHDRVVIDEYGRVGAGSEGTPVAEVVFTDESPAQARAAAEPRRAGMRSVLRRLGVRARSAAEPWAVVAVVLAACLLAWGGVTWLWGVLSGWSRP